MICDSGKLRDRKAYVEEAQAWEDHCQAAGRVDVMTSQGQTVADAVRAVGIHRRDLTHAGARSTVAQVGSGAPDEGARAG
jgi:hypothetical protein